MAKKKRTPGQRDQEVNTGEKDEENGLMCWTGIGKKKECVEIG